MKCPICGFEGDGYDAYCTRCGHSLEGDAAIFLNGNPYPQEDRTVSLNTGPYLQGDSPTDQLFTGVQAAGSSAAETSGTSGGYYSQAPGQEINFEGVGWGVQEGYQAPTPNPVPNPIPNPAPNSRGGRKPSRLPLVIAIIIAVAVIAAAVVFALNSGSAPDAISDSTDLETVAVKPSVDAYTWDELSEIADQIAAAESDEEAIDIAASYNLCPSSGALDGTQTKSVKLSDGTSTQVQIIGFAHDDASGGGKAGITFLFTDSVAFRPVYANKAQSAGWAASDLRSWLNGEFLSSLPDDLADNIVTVSKLTNNTGKTTTDSSVTTSSDKLWIPSARELCGDITWASGNIAYSNDIYNKEGSEYRLFIDSKAYLDASNEILVKKSAYTGLLCEWWTRTTRPRYGDQLVFVDASGNPHHYEASDTAYGVVPGFCL